MREASLCERERRDDVREQSRRAMGAQPSGLAEQPLGGTLARACGEVAADEAVQQGGEGPRKQRRRRVDAPGGCVDGADVCGDRGARGSCWPES